MYLGSGGDFFTAEFLLHLNTEVHVYRGLSIGQPQLHTDTLALERTTCTNQCGATASKIPTQEEEDVE